MPPVTPPRPVKVSTPGSYMLNKKEKRKKLSEREKEKKEREKEKKEREKEKKEREKATKEKQKKRKSKVGRPVLSTKKASSRKDNYMTR